MGGGGFLKRLWEIGATWEAVREVWKGRGKGFEEKHSDLKKEKNREKEEGKKEEIGRGENRETRVRERQRETTQEGRND